MESNIKNTIKLFENAKIQYANPLEINVAASNHIAEDKKKISVPPIAKPRRKKIESNYTKQAEYVNVIRVEGAQADSVSAIAPLDASSFNHYPPFDSTQSIYDSGLQAFDLALPEYVNISQYPELGASQLAYDSLQPFDLDQSEYANLLPLGISNEERYYDDSEGKWISIQKKQSKKPTKELVVKRIPIEVTQSAPIGLESKYANFPAPGLSSQPFHSYPEIQHLRVSKKKAKKSAKVIVKESCRETVQSEYPSQEGWDASFIQQFRTETETNALNSPKKLTEKQTRTPIIGKIKYADSHFIQSDIADTKQLHLSPENKLISSVEIQQDKKLNEMEKEYENSKIFRNESAGASGIKNKIRIMRKKNKSKDNFPGSLSAKFEKLKIQPIQEESILEEQIDTLTSSYEIIKRENVMKSSRFNFFEGKPKRLTYETTKSASNLGAMQNK